MALLPDLYNLLSTMHYGSSKIHIDLRLGVTSIVDEHGLRVSSSSTTHEIPDGSLLNWVDPSGKPLNQSFVSHEMAQRSEVTT